MDALDVRFFNPETQKTLTLTLPRDTPFAALTPLLQEQGFADRRKAGWRYLYQEHLCGMRHRLSDYVPEDAKEISLDLFGFSQVLV
ncbi:MAG: hypothetical protein HFG05_09915 [Oscillibacter sp.]|nr:hypothetical protein [Oscillibacter sp.]